VTAPRLTDADRDIIARARELAGALDLAALRAVTGASPELPVTLVHADALGIAQHLLAGLAAIAERPGGQAEDARRLAAIRDVLGHFDWEFHDRQLALEAIDRIADGGQA
jgi:hypothetical protein